MTNLAYKEDEKTTFGFWLYIMTDCVLFATLFATYAVLRNNTAGGPPGAELFSLPFVLIETLLLLTSSLTIGIAFLAAKHRQLKTSLIWLAVTFLLGAGFLGMELYEFNKLINEGLGWQASAFMSAFFALIGTHGLHITVGLLWITVLGLQLLKKGITTSSLKRITLLSMFWHFLDIVWVFIFTVVYLLGATQ